MRRLRARRYSATAALALVFAASATAFETDQYLAWQESIGDSTRAVNGYLDESMRTVLERINRRHPESLSCEQIPPRIYRYLFSSLLSSRVKRFLSHDPSIDRLPDDDVGRWAYQRRSIYRGAAWPFFLPMARTLRVADVHVGVDKFGHMFGFGRRYYARYRKALARGHSPEEAMRRAIVWGIRLERYVLGGRLDGVFSFADLEANFQGMLLARDLCEADPPHLVRDGAGWRLARRVDLADYVNPGFDETFNPSFYPRFRWKKVLPILRREVCPRLDVPAVRERRESYRRREIANLSDQVIASYFAEGPKWRREEQHLDAICRKPAEPGVRSAPAGR